MLVYNCKNCGKLVITALENEFNEHFCTYDCYKKYCTKNNYETHLENLKSVRNLFKD